MKKHTYEQPLAETFELQLSASVLQGGSPVDPNSVRTNSASSGYDDENDMGTI